MSLNRSPVARIAISLLIAGIVVSTASFLSGFLTGNVHVVAQGELYRSAQLNSSQLEHNVKRYGIASIINLRGENVDSPWYVSEIGSAARLRVQHFDFRMSAKRKFAQEDAAKLIALMASVPKPALIHCASGTDRTSLAAALYLAAIKKSDESAAENQMQIKFGHVALPFLDAYAIDESWESLEHWLGYPDT